MLARGGVRAGITTVVLAVMLAVADNLHLAAAAHSEATSAARSAASSSASASVSASASSSSWSSSSAAARKVSAAKKQWIVENDYSVQFLTDLPARVNLNGAVFDTSCTCRPNLPQDATRQCVPHQVTVTPEVPFPGDRDRHRPNIDAAGLRKLVGEPTTLRNVEITRHHFSCCDGRSSDEIIGTWGGDAGEMMLAIAVWEDLAGRNLTATEVAK
jgi:hypothetical protein